MQPIRYLDVCSGYSAFTVANQGLGFEAVGYAEIEAFPCALLGHHYGAGAPRYMPDPDEEGIGVDERKKRAAMLKSVRSLSASHFGNGVPNFGDFSQIREDDVDGPVDLLIGGTPCQAFSVAGKRLGLDDPRGNLTLEFLALAKRLRVEWLAWENVPGFLSHDEGRTMGTFLRFLGELGYGWAYRVLDVQYIRVDGHERAIPQRRKRVILVGHLGDSAGPAAVLFDRESLRGDPAPRRQAGQGTAHDVAPSLVSSGRGVERTGETREQDPVVAVAFGGNNTAGELDVSTSLTSHGGPHGGQDFASETFVAVAPTLDASYGRLQGHDNQHIDGGAGLFVAQPVAHALRAEGFDASEDGSGSGSGRGTPIVPVAFSLRGREGEPQAEPAEPAEPGLSPSLRAVGGGSSHAFVAQEWAVRRLIPTECERLMGVPDGFTDIMFRGKPAADGPRYKALGNSQGANKMRWLAHGLRDVIDIQRGAK